MRLIFLMHMPLPGLILTECFMCCERPISVAIHSNGWESGCTGIGGNDFAFVLETQSGLGTLRSAATGHPQCCMLR